ncbi:hypothetical protein BHM03_00040764 [Ensete ventricosum]|nr:hypothetical protein BHM03_00040764 [Ensete ventricosum]
MRLGTHLECIGSSSRVSGVCQDGAREFTERRPGLTERLSGKAEKLVRSWEGIKKLAGNTLGDHWRKTVRLAVRIPEAAGLAGAMIVPPRPVVVSPVPYFQGACSGAADGCTAHTRFF